MKYTYDRQISLKVPKLSTPNDKICVKKDSWIFLPISWRALLVKQGVIMLELTWLSLKEA
jgi:hypothetical protein